MIVIGYPGIGKSTICKNNNSFIDLESSNFNIVRIPDVEISAKPDNWYLAYCNIAEDLSRQGYTVFVSSHREVRLRLHESKEYVLGIAPHPSLKEKWIERLRKRIEDSEDEQEIKKNKAALSRAETRNNFELDTQEILDDKNIDTKCLKNMDYDLYWIVLYNESKHNLEKKS